MGVDFAALKDRIRRMKEQKEGNFGDKSKKPKWNPPLGKSVVRVVPMSLTEDYDPVKTLQLIYGIKIKGWNHTILSLKGNFGKADPFDEFRSQLFREGTPVTKELAKKLFPKDAHFVPVVVREEEDLGVRWWGCNKTIYEDLMDKFFDEDWGDMTNPITGRDITVTRKPKSGNDQFDKITASVSPNKTPLSEDSSLVEQWVDSIPDIHEIFEIETYDELEKKVKEWYRESMELVDDDKLDDGVDYSPSGKKSDDGVVKEEENDNIDDAFDQILND